MSHNHPSTEQVRQEALARWQRCIDSAASQPLSTAIRITSDMLDERCEGHRRDVLMAFPVSQEHQLDLLLRQRAHERILHSSAVRLAR